MCEKATIVVKIPELWNEPSEGPIPGLQLCELEQVISPWNAVFSPGRWG